MTMTEKEIDAEVERIQKLSDAKFEELMADVKTRIGPDFATKRVTWADLLQMAAQESVLRRELELDVEFLEKRIKELEDRLGQVEGRGLRFAGTYQRAQTYERGAVCSHEGSGWVALRPVKEGEAPSKSDAWQLFVKRGVDAR